MSGHTHSPVDGPPRIDGFEDLLRRLDPAHLPHVEASVLPRSDAASAFSYSATGGRLSLRGTDTSALSAGLYHYTKQHAGAQFTWDNLALDLPPTLPDAPPTTRRTDLRLRYYLNFVTFGYTAAFWDWQRWEQEIDWMALHGINAPLMTVGHEAVMSRTLMVHGLSQDEALAWIGSPAHFPWTWMGCTHSWGGPVSPASIERGIELGQQILDRQRALGMTPVLPGFGGQVPAQLAPAGTRRTQWQGWQTPILEPGSEQFQDIAATFYRTQSELFGTDHHYAVDPFIESVPPRGDTDWLRGAGAGIYRAMSIADPEATWVLQGWPFHYHRDFWTPERAEAFLQGAPPEQMILLDLWAEHAPMWQRTEAMFGRRWLWCAVHNFGSRFAVFGDLHGAAEDVAQVRRSPDRGRLEGLGLTMEAIENNAVYYELITDLAWSDIEIGPWLSSYARDRYRTPEPAAVEVWEILTATLYAPGRTRSIPSPVIARPWTDQAPFATQRSAGEFVDAREPQRQSANIDAENDPSVLGDLPALVEVVRLLLSLPASPARDRDLVDVLSHVLAQQCRRPIRAVLRGYTTGDPGAVRRAMTDLQQLIIALDDLAATSSHSLVGTWIARARARGTERGEADTFERDARTLLTVWGEQTSGLHDYSGRHWAGLLRDFYLPRWQLWGEWLAQGAPDADTFRAAVVDHEEVWRSDRTPYPVLPVGSTAEVSEEILGWLDLSPASTEEPGTTTTRE